MEAIDTSKIKTDLGITLGNEDAPITVVEFTNLRCPFCKQWWDERHGLLNDYITSGRIKHTIKLFDKESPALAKGNIMHHHVPNDDTAIDAISAIFETQDIWGNMASDEDIARFAQEELGLTLQTDTKVLQAIVEETKESNVFFIPTMIINDTVFDQKITDDALIALIEK